MTSLITSLRHWAYRQPSATALAGEHFSLSYFDLALRVEQTARQLAAHDVHVLGILCDNGPAWAIVDLAAQLAGITCVPIPQFFSNRQIEHAIRDAGIELIFTDNLARLQGCAIPVSRVSTASEACADLSDDRPYRWLRLAPGAVTQTHQRIAKITYTSGTTGEPKGVCLSQPAIDCVAQSLASAAGLHTDSCHLAVLPLATLLENIGGLYAPLIAGASTFLLPMQQLGASGSANRDIATLHDALSYTHANTLILVPQLLQNLVEFMEAGRLVLPHLQFVAVGGAPVAPALLQRAAALNLPVFEGYGLSECASVVAVNTPQHYRPGSVGKPLPHVTLDFADDGEILVRGAGYAGYLHHAQDEDHTYVATGDCGYLDADGYLYLTGRKKNMFITAWGRNIAPEWVERELVLQPAIQQAAVFGEARPWNVALIVPAAGSDAQAINDAIARVNTTLPDYARIGKWLCAEEPFSVANHELTATGRLRRSVIQARYTMDIDQLYATTEVTQRKFA